jgi:hypothetical protein
MAMRAREIRRLDQLFRRGFPGDARIAPWHDRPAGDARKGTVQSASVVWMVDDGSELG